jgi:hypothetical protein
MAQATKGKPTTQISRADTVEDDLALRPEDGLLTEEYEKKAMRLVSRARAAKLLPVSMTNEGALLVFLAGHDLGMSPMEALRSLYVVNGRVAAEAHGMMAIVFRRGLGSIDIKLDPEGEWAEVTATRTAAPPMTYTSRFTKAMAERAKLWGTDIWAKYPEWMLKWRAVADACRTTFPDLFSGIHTSEELGARVKMNAAGELSPDYGPDEDEPLDPAVVAATQPQMEEAMGAGDVALVNEALAAKNLEDETFGTFLLSEFNTTDLAAVPLSALDYILGWIEGQPARPSRLDGKDLTPSMDEPAEGGAGPEDEGKPAEAAPELDLMSPE